MLDARMGFPTAGNALPLATAFLLVAATAGFFMMGEQTSGPQPGTENSGYAGPAVSDTLDIPTVEEAQQMIVGNWVEDVANEAGSHKRGAKRWVFTEEGTVRKYRDGQLFAEQDYEIVQRYDEMQDPDEIVGYLKFTRPSGEVYHATLMNVKRKRNPILIVSHHGAGATVFVPRRVFE